MFTFLTYSVGVSGNSIYFSEINIKISDGVSFKQEWHEGQGISVTAQCFVYTDVMLWHILSLKCSLCTVMAALGHVEISIMFELIAELLWKENC